MMRHEQMKNNATYRSGDRGLHYFCSGIIRDAASQAARASFAVCDGASAGWRSWTHRSGRMVKLAERLLVDFIEENPNAPAEALYTTLSYFPCHPGTTPYMRGSFWQDRPPAWTELPPAVQAAYETFRHVYLQLWIIGRAHHPDLKQARPELPPPRLVQSAPPPPPAPEPYDDILRGRMLELGFSEAEIRSRFSHASMHQQSAEQVLELAVDDACYRAWCTEQARRKPKEYPKFPSHSLTPDRVYLRAVYKTWSAQYTRKTEKVSNRR